MQDNIVYRLELSNEEYEILENLQKELLELWKRNKRYCL